MEVVYLHNFRRGPATNSSSTHSVIYRNKEEMFEDLNIFECDYYDRCTSSIAASKEAKIKYILAHIREDKFLVKLLAERYPSMKQYFPLLSKKGEYGDDAFGMCCRDSLYDRTNVEFSYEFLCDLIDDDDKIIIGGSDEQDFVYEQTDGNKEAPLPGDAKYGAKTSKNGNYFYSFGQMHDVCDDSGKIRYTKKREKPIPEYPELIDMKITDKCQHNCPMCFEGSSMKGKHADIHYLNMIVRQASHFDTMEVEYSIGGGNVLLYPHLEELLITIKQHNGHACITIKADDVDTVLKKKKLLTMLAEYVDGIGVSVFNCEDAKKAAALQKVINKTVKEIPTKRWGDSVSVIAHVIPEYIGAEMVKNIATVLDETKSYVSMLYLGYKPLERGADAQWHELTDSELKTIFDRTIYLANIDTLFGERYKKFLDANFETKKTFTQLEGEFSMFIDGVSEKAYKSSYDLSKPYKIDYMSENNLPAVFQNIREDSGFERYVEKEISYES